VADKHDKSDHEKLRQALGRLSKHERLVCIWKRAGFSSRDIAKFEGGSVASVNAVFARARRKLREALSER
jgi:DNA-directed RNA polymerase specialized sigma24 family protein